MGCVAATSQVTAGDSSPEKMPPSRGPGHSNSKESLSSPRGTSCANSRESLKSPCGMSPANSNELLNPPRGTSRTDPKKELLKSSSSRSLSLDQDALIIFDWDDTLLCSSALCDNDWKPMPLESLEKEVASVLQQAMRLGNTVIVTNGDEGWIEDTACRYLPGIAQLLKKMHIVSAKTRHESQWPRNPVMWKYLAFQDLLKKKMRSNPAADGTNLVVLGDSLAEIKAARHATQAMSMGLLVKTVRFKAKPSPEELLGELRKLAQNLEVIVQDDRTSDRALVKHKLPFAGQMSSLPSTWKLLSKS